MKLHPGCGCPTPFIAKIIAICDLIFGLIGIFWFVWLLEDYHLLKTGDSSIFGNSTSTPRTTHSPPPIQNVTSFSTQPPISVTSHGFMINDQSWNIVLSAFYTSINLIAFVLLLSASNDKSICRDCKLTSWFIIRLTIFIFKCFLYIWYLAVGADLYDHIPHIIFMAIHLYGLWVVWVFIKEIKLERRNNGKRSSQITLPYSVDDTTTSKI